MLGHIRRQSGETVSRKPDVVKRLSLYRDKVKALETLGLGFEPCTKADLLDKAFDLQDRYGLLTNDSLSSR